MYFQDGKEKKKYKEAEERLINRVGIPEFTVCLLWLNISNKRDILFLGMPC